MNILNQSTDTAYTCQNLPTNGIMIILYYITAKIGVQVSHLIEEFMKAGDSKLFLIMCCTITH